MTNINGNITTRSAQRYGPTEANMQLDFTKGTFIPCMEVDYDPATGAGEVITTMPVAQLLEFVLDPKASEDPRRVAEDPRLAETAMLRKEVQRAVEGAKLRNASSYARYLVEGYTGQRPTMVPPVTLYHRGDLEVIDLGSGLKALVLPFGDTFVCIDGETQRIGWAQAAREMPSIIQKRAKASIHFGKPLEVARQGFYDLNTREVKPNAAVAISMDTVDPATRITRELMEASEILGERGVNLTRRQLRDRDPEVTTIAALRTAVTTTMFGSAGLAFGTRPTAERLADLDLTEEQLSALGDAVVEVWSAIINELEDPLARRGETVTSAPGVLAGIGVVAHHAMPAPPRTVPEWSLSMVLERLRGIHWERTFTRADGSVGSRWEGIAGKFTPAGRLSLGGPKEVGHSVAEALEDPNSTGGKRIRASQPD